jgi:hypothetical protein
LALIRRLGREAEKRGLLAAAQIELEAGHGRDGVRLEGAALTQGWFRDGETSRNWGRFGTGREACSTPVPIFGAVSVPIRSGRRTGGG